MKNLSLLNDVVFKCVFGSEKQVPVLRALLNALLGLEGQERIIELAILNPGLDKDYILDKGVILDVKARDGQRRLFNIEVQVSAEVAYVERAIYYLARLFAGQLERGEPYRQLARTIGISLTDFVLFPDLPDLHSRYRLHDETHRRELTDIFELHFIELAKFRTNRPKELRGRFEKWLHVLKFGELYEGGVDALPEELREEEGIEMALEAMWQVSSSEQVREMVEARMKARRDWATMMEAAELKGLEKGREQGLEKGREQGQGEFLVRLLEARFGAVPEETRRRIEGATEEELLEWGRRLFTADDLETVFSEPGRGS